MKKVYIKRFLNEDVNISDPTLAQQYLAVKNQIADKQTKKDLQMKLVNQIDNEINILQKNLIAIETKDSANQQKTQTQTKPENQQTQQTQNTSTTNTQQPASTANTTTTNTQQPKTNESYSKPSSFDDYVESVIHYIDEFFHDGETYVYDHEKLVNKYFKNKKSPRYTANIIISIERNHNRNEGYIGGDAYNKGVANVTTPTRVRENVNEYKEISNLLEPKSNEEQASLILSDKIGEQRNLLLSKLKNVHKNEQLDLFINLLSNEYINSAMEIYLSVEKQKKLLNFFNKGYDISAFNYDKSDFDKLPDFKKIVEERGWYIFNKETNYDCVEYIFIKPPVNIIKESIYTDLTDSIESEMAKLSNIKNYIEQFDNEEKHNTDDLRDSLELHKTDISDEVSDIKKPFVPSEEEKIVDETLKAEVKDKPFVPNLVENEDLDTELEMLNYEDEDQPTDEYVFHVRINSDSDTEIIAKIYKENEDDNWTLRVVKGDEEPLQSMEFDGRLDKLEIISYLADMYDDVEIMDPKEYHYLLDDKEKVDNEFFTKEKLGEDIEPDVELN